MNIPSPALVSQGMRQRLWIYGIGLVMIFVAATVQLGEGALRIDPSFRRHPDARSADRLASDVDATWTAVEAAAQDGVTLRASLFRPRLPNGRAAILLHGVGSSRDGMLGHARYLLERGYTCLLPDSRGHGASGGELISYGLEEARDVARWVAWLEGAVHPESVYGLGESMGAAVLLESLPLVPQFRAVVAECSFADFRAVGGDRLAQFSGIPAPWLFRPLVESGLVYVRLRYGIALADASPEQALRHSATPVLLIHGTLDGNIPPIHSRRLARVRPASTTLWEVAGAGHVDSLGVEPARFPQAVLNWFDTAGAR